MRHTFSIGDRSGLQAGQSSTRTLFLRSQDFVMCAECGFALSCWNMHGRPWKRCLLEGSILCSKISMYFSALMVPSQKCKLPLPRALTQPHTMTDPGFWTVAGNSLDDPFLLWVQEHTATFLPKNTWNTDSSDHSTRFPTVWWSIPNAPEPREVDRPLLDTCKIRAFLLARTGFNWHFVDVNYAIVVTEKGFAK